ncbi:hypothetical protein OY671_009378, partial [Metschnikowia pulcherrima]
RSDRDADGSAWSTFDRAGSAVNASSADTMAESATVSDALDAQPPKGSVIRSGKPTGFIVGAAVNEFAESNTPEQGRASVARGHTLSVAMQGDSYIETGTVKAVTTPIESVEGADSHGHDWWRESASRDSPSADIGAVVMRKDPPFDMEYVYSTHSLEYAQAQGAKVFNSGAAIRNHPEKSAITEISEFTAPTSVTRNMARSKAFHDTHHDVIV